MEYRKSLVFLVLIAFLAAGLRLFNLSSLPPSLNWDEVSHGYNAYSILKTGKDQWGQILPVFNFRAYGDYPLPLNLYLTIPFIAVFGLSEFAIRFPHALLGIGTVVATYFFVVGLTKRRELALIASLLVAVDPWTLFASRFVLQSNLAVFFLTLSAALFFNRDKNKYFLPLSIFSLGLTLYSYHTTRIVSPLILISVGLIYGKEIKLSVLSIAISAILFIPGVYVLTQQSARSRSDVVFILNDYSSNIVASQRQSSGLNPLLSRLIYNKVTYFASNSASNYLGYFSPQFLFFKGGTQYQFSIPNRGILNLASLPFFYIGLIWLLRKAKDSKDYRLVFAWLILAPIPASVTVDKFAVIRATSMLPLPQLLSSLGLFAFVDFFDKKRINFVRPATFVLFFVVLAFGLENYMADYINNYSKNYSWSWQYGYKQIVEYAKENYNNYDKIIVTKKYGEPHEFFLFYWPWDPAKYQDDPNAIRFFQSDWYWVDRFDKFCFVNDWQAKDMKLESGGKIDCANKKCLLITSPDNVPKGWKNLGTINFSDHKPAFEIYGN